MKNNFITNAFFAVGVLFGGIALYNYAYNRGANKKEDELMPQFNALQTRLVKIESTLKATGYGSVC